jgi:hypothetical protein
MNCRRFKRPGISVCINSALRWSEPTLRACEGWALE